MIAEARVCQHFSYTTYRDGLERTKINKQITCLGKKKKKANQLIPKVGFNFQTWWNFISCTASKKPHEQYLVNGFLSTQSVTVHYLWARMDTSSQLTHASSNFWTHSLNSDTCNKEPRVSKPVSSHRICENKQQGMHVGDLLSATVEQRSAEWAPQHWTLENYTHLGKKDIAKEARK